MAPAPRDLPTPEEERELLRRLAERDPTAPASIAQSFLDSLIDWLRNVNDQQIDEHLCVQSAGDAIIAFIKNPASYRPDRTNSLFSYLKMSASGDLKNALRTEKSRRGPTVPLECVELSPDAGKYLAEVDDPSTRAEIVEEVQRAEEHILGTLRAALLPQEREALELLLQGERKTPAYAQALGIDHLPQSEQAAEVKRFKDKIAKRIERGREDHGKSS
jgi:hypothetical protein